eukprot:2010883-Amphidinium_carterae.1
MEVILGSQGSKRGRQSTRSQPPSCIKNSYKSWSCHDGQTQHQGCTFARNQRGDGDKFKKCSCELKYQECRCHHKTWCPSLSRPVCVTQQTSALRASFNQIKKTPVGHALMLTLLHGESGFEACRHLNLRYYSGTEARKYTTLKSIGVIQTRVTKTGQQVSSSNNTPTIATGFKQIK